MSIQIDRYSIYHLIHAIKTVLYEIFVRSNGAVLSCIVFSTLYNSLYICEMKVDDSSSALGFLETPQ